MRGAAICPAGVLARRSCWDVFICSVGVCDFCEKAGPGEMSRWRLGNRTARLRWRERAGLDVIEESGVLGRGR
jgi:hypothetical protein